MKINKLKLNNFRNHHQFNVDIEKNIIAITGFNGVGKTNILEAVSLLMPGKGFHKSKLSELQNQNSSETPWSVYAEIESDDVITQIGTGYDAQKFLETGKDKRIIRINGETARGQNALAEYVSMIWLTPANDLTFLSNTQSREFLDNLCELFFPDYSSHLAVYNNARSQRRNLLFKNRYDDKWLAALETQMAQKAIALTYSRAEVVERINKAMILTRSSGFPPALVEIEGEIENILKTKKALEAENDYIELLKSSRQQDAYTGKTACGPHRTKFKVTHTNKNQIAELCSTGEQKALLLSITLAACAAKKNFSGITPIILLDEIIAHLDSEKREKLLQFLVDINAQIWASGVNSKEFEFLDKKVQNIKL